MDEIVIMKSVFDENMRLAHELNERISANGTFVINVMGAPGAGKTSSLLQIIERLGSDCAVIEGDIESDIDTRALKKRGVNAVQINTGGACHLDSPVIASAWEKLSTSAEFLFIENVGNLVCPAEFVIGEHVKLLIVSAADGSDKPYKYPLAFEKADAILVNKRDLMEYVEFDDEYFTAGVRRQNKTVPVMHVSAKTGEGFGEVADWLIRTKQKFFTK